MEPQTQLAIPQPQPCGWRWVTRTLEDGTTEVDEVPLTLEDVLHPQEGDIIAETPQHATDRTYLTLALDTRCDRLDAIAVVNTDLLTDLDLPGVRPVSPDIGVYHGLKQPRDPRAGMFYPHEVEAECHFLLEIVLPSTRSNDLVKKKDLYHRACVPLYVILDQEREDGPRRLLAFLWEPHGYVPAPLDGEGMLVLARLGLRLGLIDDRAVLYDIESEQELADYKHISEQLSQLQARDEEREKEIADTIDRLRDESAARTKAQKKLRKAKQKIKTVESRAEAAEQAADAGKQKLEAAEQKLEAAEQVIDAGKQKLEAAEQVIEAGKQKLEAAEQKLEAAEQVIEASKQKFETADAARVAAEAEIANLRALLAMLQGHTSS